HSRGTACRLSLSSRAQGKRDCRSLVCASQPPSVADCMKPIISPNIRIRYPDCFDVGEFSIVDDYCYFSARVKIGFCSHIGNNCSIGGGPERLFSLGDFSSLSAGVKVWCSSNDLTKDQKNHERTHRVVATRVRGGGARARRRSPNQQLYQ